MSMKVLPVLPVDATVTPASFGIAAQASVVNVPSLLPDTEYSFALPDGTKAFEIKTRANSELWLAYQPGTSGTAYVLVPRGGAEQKSSLNTSGVTLYFQTKLADTVQITYWV